MHRPGLTLLALLGALATASSASAQPPPTYPLGPMAPAELSEEPDTVPRGPIGDYPEDWGKCVQDNPPGAQLYPHELDVRGVDPATPNPLLGTKWFVDRMEPP